MKITPLNGNVLVSVEKKDNVTKSGIILATAGDERMEIAEVLEIAQNVEQVKKGDRIHFKTYSLSEVEIEDEIYGFIKQEDILAKE